MLHTKQLTQAAPGIGDSLVTTVASSQSTRPRRYSFSGENVPKELKVAIDVVKWADAESIELWWSENYDQDLGDLKQLVKACLDRQGNDFDTDLYTEVEFRATALKKDVKVSRTEWEDFEARKEQAAIPGTGRGRGRGRGRGHDHKTPFLYDDINGKDKHWLSKDRFIGQGAWSEVYACKVWDKGQKTVAFKKLRHRTLHQCDESERISRLILRMERERDIWKGLKHPNIAPLLGSVTSPWPGLVTELYENGTIAHYLAKNPDVNRLSLAIGCSKGLEYLHSKNVLHGDMRESNVLVTDQGNPVLIDFGHSVLDELDPTIPTESRVPTEYRYLARERAVSIEKNIASRESDVYSLGCVLLYIFTGHQPFRHVKKSEEVYLLLLDYAKNPVNPGSFSDSPEIPKFSPLWPVLSECWADVKKRPEADAVLASLEAMNDCSEPIAVHRDLSCDSDPLDTIANAEDQPLARSSTVTQATPLLQSLFASVYYRRNSGNWSFMRLSQGTLAGSVGLNKSNSSGEITRLLTIYFHNHGQNHFR